jgi:hypothetical protein
MKPIHTLHKYIPGNLAMNAALLIRNVRPVFQVDAEENDVKRVPDIRKAIRTVAGLECETWSYDIGVLVWIRDRRLPADVKKAIATLQSLPKDAPLRSISPHVRTCLRLRCPVSAYFDEDNRFRVLLSVKTADGDEYSFKQQMCVDPRETRKLFEELLRYSDVADEMGFYVLEMKVLKVQPRHANAMAGPRLPR